MDRVLPVFISALGSVVLLAIIATLVSKQAQTGQVLQDFGTAFSSIIKAAVTPVTGTSGSQFGTAPALGTAPAG
jgi:hypothetical protein